MGISAEYLRQSVQTALQNPQAAGAILVSSVKYYWVWRQSMKDGLDPLEFGVPWITFDACRFLERVLSRNSVVFEYGSGGSTVFYCDRVAKVLSVENDRNWFARVQSHLAKTGRKNAQIYLIEPVHSQVEVQDSSDPQAYQSGSPLCINRSFEAYVRCIDQYPDESFDLVAIDGRARPSCILHSLSKVKVGGYLMLDNSERVNYRAAQRDFLSNWKRTKFHGPGPYNTYFWQTTFWRKGEK